MVQNGNDLKTELLSTISEKQQISFNDLTDIYFSRGIGKIELKSTLEMLERENAIASRANGGILTYYVLEKEPFRKVLIVEDDKNINKLMAISIGKDYEINQIYDGGKAISFIRNEKPDLVVLDLMLPNKDGLDICQTIKTDKSTNNIIVILVSAMDPTSNRFKGIKYGADYYIKKPFEPKELSALVNIFLRKKGKRFDPLIDLPGEERLSLELERSIKEGSEYILGTLNVDNISTYAKRFGEKSAMIILRLVSQLLQDILKKYNNELFVGFLNSTQFVIAGKKEIVSSTVQEISTEFDNVFPFILQDQGYKPVNLDLPELFGREEPPKLLISFTESDKKERIAKREEVLKEKSASQNGDVTAYTYDELYKMLGGSGNLDIVITRENNNVKLRVGKDAEQ